jgi:hypothetical protein
MSAMKTTRVRCSRVARRLLLAAVAAVATLPVLTRADRPASPAVVSSPATSTPPATRPDTSPGEPRGKGARARAAEKVEEVNFSKDQWDQFASFMKEKSPKKWAMFDKMPERPLKQGLKAKLARRYKELQVIQSTDAKRYQIELTEIRVEDEIYGILEDLRANRNVDENEAKLREQTGALIDARHDWRKVRVARIDAELSALKLDDALAALRKEVAREEAARDSESGKNRRDEQIKKRVAEFKKNMTQPRPNKPLPGGDRPPGEPGTEPADAPAAD